MLHRWGESDSQNLDNLVGIFQCGGEGFKGRVTDATTCPWKTRRTDNTGSSVFGRDDLGFTGGEALTEPVTRLRGLLHRWNPDQRGSQHNISLFLQILKESRASMPGIPNTSASVHLLPIQCQGKRNEKEREDGAKCSRKPSVQRWVGLYLDGTVSPSVSPAHDKSPEMFWILVTCAHIIYTSSSHWPDVGELRDKALILFPLSSDIRTTQAARDTLLKTGGHMAWESSSSRCQVATFSNTQTQWLDSSLIIKKGLCAFNNPGKRGE